MNDTRITIGIMGGLVSNENMGCVALTYSLLAMLNRISNRIKCDFDYVIFEYDQDYSENKFDELRQYFKLICSNWIL